MYKFFYSLSCLLGTQFTAIPFSLHVTKTCHRSCLLVFIVEVIKVMEPRILAVVAFNGMCLVMRYNTSSVCLGNVSVIRSMRITYKLSVKWVQKLVVQRFH